MQHEATQYSAVLSAAALRTQATATPRTLTLTLTLTLPLPLTQAQSLASMFDMDGIDALLDGGGQAAPKLGYFVELTLRDADGNEVLKLTG